MENGERKVWTEEVRYKQEDKILEQLVNTHGPKKWALISREFKEKFNIANKTGKQCRERWNNNLNPKITKDSWSAQEEKILFEKQKIYGNKWSEISKFLKGRTDNSTKNHFYSIVRKNLRRYNKHKPEKERIIGNIQDLLNDPEIAKVLLKKPRHYYKKTQKKHQEEKKTHENASPEKAPSSKAKPQPTYVKPREIRTNKRPPQQIVCPTPISEITAQSISTKSFVFSPDNLLENMYQANTTASEMQSSKSTIDNIFKFNFSPRDVGYTPRQSYFHDGQFFRNESRNNSLKSLHGEDFERNNSRKNSEKEVSCYGLRSESRKNSSEPMDYAAHMHMSLGFSLPHYSPTNRFQYYSTPKHQKQ